MPSQPEIRIEKAGHEHVDSLLRLMRALEDADPSATPFDVERRRKNWEEFLQDESLGRAWLILDGERSVGYAVLTLGFSFEFGGQDAFLDEIYVEEKYRGRGIGTHALQLVEAAARELGVKAVHLVVSRRNARAIAFYARTGYIQHERLLMTKRLSQ